MFRLVVNPKGIIIPKWMDELVDQWLARLDRKFVYLKGRTDYTKFYFEPHLTPNEVKEQNRQLESQCIPI